jgi:hypothetical protein
VVYCQSAGIPGFSLVKSSFITANYHWFLKVNSPQCSEKKEKSWQVPLSHGFSDAFRTLEHTTKMYTLRIHSTYTRSCFVAMLDLEPGIFPARHDRSSSHFQLAWSMNKEFANIKTCNFIVTSRTNFSNIGNLDILR